MHPSKAAARACPPPGTRRAARVVRNLKKAKPESVANAATSHANRLGGGQSAPASAMDVVSRTSPPAQIAAMVVSLRVLRLRSSSPLMPASPRAVLPTVRPAWLTVMVCGVSALLTLVLPLTSVPSWRVSDVPFLAFAVTPYLALAGLAAAFRRRRQWSWSLFGLTVALSLAGVGCFAVDSWMFHTVAEYRMVQRFTVIAVPLLQLAIVVPVALIALSRGPGR